jgi:uncharacterized membrane protein YjjB (DUF3815 family)
MERELCFAMIGAVPIPIQNAVLMTGYGYVKRWTTGDHENNNILLGVFIGGTLGGILQSFVMSPIELIKVSQRVIGKSVSAATASVISGLLPSITTATTSTSSKSASVSAWRGLSATLYTQR